LDIKADKARLLEALGGLVDGTVENDVLNRLVLNAGMSARQVALLRAYQMYYSQLNLVTSRAFVTSALLAHPDVSRLLMAYFETRFDPALRAPGGADQDDAAASDGSLPGLSPAARAPLLKAAADAVLEALGGVSSLAE